MAHTQPGRRVVASESTIEYDPEIAYELMTDGLPNVSTANIQQAINSENIHFTGLKRQGNRRVQYHGREDFFVEFRNSSNNKWASCTCSSPAPCSHIYWALNQYANAMCRRSCMGRARGVIYPLGNDGSGQRVSIEIEGLDDIWPVPSPEFNTAQHASFVNAYIHQRLGNKTLEDMQTSLFGYNRHMKTFTDERGSRTARPILVCSDRPIYAATQRLLEPIIAQACIRDQQFAEECEAVLTPVRQTAILLEDLQCAAARNFAALSESWLGRQTDHHERLAKSNWVEYVYDIFDVYRSYLAERVSKGWDDNTLEATNAAASALIFMLRGAVDRTSLWHELTLTDLQYDRPRDFWTNVFLAFRSIVEQDGLSREHRSELRAIRERAKELATFNRPTSGIIHALRDIIHA